MRNIIASAFLIGFSSSSFAKGLDTLSEEAATKEEKATSTEDVPEDPKTLPPLEAVPPASGAEPIQEQKEPTLPLNPEKEPIVRSSTSKRLDQRLALGTSFGWAKVKPNSGTWEGLGATDISVSWRVSKKPEGSLFVTGRYAPYTGTWYLNNRYYNTTAHGLFVGPEWRITSPESSLAVKAGVELGYLMVYSSPQDGQEAEGAAKAGKANLGAHSQFEWTFLEKVHAGPFLRVNGGGFSIAQLGGAVSFVF